MSTDAAQIRTAMERYAAALVGNERGAIVVREALGPRRIEVERVLVYTVAGALLRECWVYDQDQRAIDELIGTA